jgi:hypothetical protein
MKNLIRIILFVFIISLIFTGSTVFANEEYVPEIPTLWTKITKDMYDPDGVFEYSGLRPSCSNYPGTDPEFSFFAKGGTVNKLVIYFQSGGACWFYNMCIAAPTYTLSVTTTTMGLKNGYGIFDLDNPKNPFKKWSFVFIPYCTGDLHIGANDATYDGFEIRHRGFVNFQAVLAWIKNNFAGPEQIFITGSSAGGWGTNWNFPFVADAYPNSRIDFFADAGGGTFWDEEDFIMQKENWDIQAADVYKPLSYRYGYEQVELLMAEYPNSKGGSCVAAFDELGAFFISVVQNRDNPSLWGYYPPFDPEDPEEIWCDIHDLVLLETTSLLMETNYRSYVIEGTVHTFLKRPEFYTENSGGIPLHRWLKAMVKNPRHATGQWQNLACPGCFEFCE